MHDVLTAEIDRDLQHIPKGDINQNVLRSIYQLRRGRDLASDPATPAHISLMSAIASVRKAAHDFRPLFDARYFRSSDGDQRRTPHRREGAA